MAYMAGQTQNVQVPNYSGVNIQIFNPSVVAPGAAVPGANVNAQTYTTNSAAYPSNYYTQNLAQPPTPPPIPSIEEKNETEKREIVQLTDDYIKTLESYLDNKEDKNVRLLGAKEVLARLQEDKSRKNDEALNALINKMLQDDYPPVKFIAMAALESGDAAGNAKSAELLKEIQQQETSNESVLNSENSLKKEDALKASKILLRMSGNTIEKEFDVKNKKAE